MSESMVGWKQEALQRFCDWLNALPDDAPPVQDEVAVDLYTLAEELTALKQEMRTLGRTTARMADSSQAVSDTLKEELPRLLKGLAPAAPAIAPDKEVLVQARRAAIRPFLIELGDLSVSFNELKDRKTEITWPFYVSGKVRRQLMQAQSRPLDVLAVRVNALLSRHALEPMAKPGAPFDAMRMNAAGVSTEGRVPPGCISDVVRQGFLCGDEVLRFAEVIVEESI